MRGEAQLRRLVERGFYRHRTIRKVVTHSPWPKLKSEPPDVSHLALFHEIPDGAVQRDEALFLYSIVRVVRPQTVLEIGFLRGLSAFNFLRALDEDAHLYSVDISPRARASAEERLGNDPRFTLRIKSQDAVTREDIDGRMADLVFLDASHDLALNQRTFENLQRLMAPNAILAIHDTGAMPRALIPALHWWHLRPEGWVGDEREVKPDERAFVNWLLEEHPEFSELHLHSRRTLRCGITLIQRSAPLLRPDQAAKAATPST